MNFEVRHPRCVIQISYYKVKIVVKTQLILANVPLVVFGRLFILYFMILELWIIKMVKYSVIVRHDKILVNVAAYVISS
jgi:hypothetical protein